MPQHGWVKNVREKQGFCFITDATGLDRFAHFTQIFGIEIEQLLPGEEVTFEPDDHVMQCLACGWRYHGGAAVEVCTHSVRGVVCGKRAFGTGGPRAVNVWTVRMPKAPAAGEPKPAQSEEMHGEA